MAGALEERPTVQDRARAIAKAQALSGGRRIYVSGHGYVYVPFDDEERQGLREGGAHVSL
jgi:hypothetical protein